MRRRAFIAGLGGGGGGHNAAPGAQAPPCWVPLAATDAMAGGLRATFGVVAARDHPCYAGGGDYQA
jgi:hypothetical protein